jgi:signal transduction histidine kinase/ligand-binding sensor domain-containing protein/CheY-like chemotaxis protein
MEPPRAIHEYRYEAWEEAEGLPHYSINAIEQGADGYLWLATYYGLVRFDGTRFVVFDHSNTPQMRANQIWALVRDSSGTLWMGTANGVLSLRGGVFSAVTQPEVSGVSVHALSLAADGGLWIGTHGRGVFHLREGRLSALGPSGEVIRALHEDSDGSLWIGSNSGLFHYSKGRFRKFTKADGLPGERVLSLFHDRRGTLAVGTAGGLAWLRAGRLETEPDASFAGQVVWALTADRHHSVWIGMLGGGLARHHDGAFEHFKNFPKLASKAITAIYEDREGSLWLGTSGGGLGRLRNVTFRTLDTDSGLPGNLVQTVLSARDGTLWVGYNGQGLAHLDSAGRFLKAYNHDNGLPSNDIWCLLEDHRGRILAGAYDGSIARLDRGSIEVLPVPEPLRNTPVFALFEDRRETLWVGTYNHGLIHLQPGSGARAYGTRDGLAGNQVRVIQQDAAGRLWVGTHSGLSVLENGHFTNYTTRNGLAGDFVFAIHEAPDHSIWIGSFEGGLTLMKNGRFTRFNQSAGFPNASVFQILPDRQDHLWVSSSAGIFRLSRGELADYAAGRVKHIHPAAYGVTDGLSSRECNGGQPAGATSPDGRLWFPTMKGLATVQPASVITNPVPPPVVVERVVANGRDYSLSAPIQLPAGSRNLEIHYTGLSLVAPAKVRFRYRLIPFDHDWVDADNRRTAFYANLQPGTYHFQVIAANNDGLWNSTGASLDVSLKPHFYQTGLFLLTLLGAAGGCIFAVHHLRTRSLRRQNEELEARVGERTSSLQHANDELSELIEQLKVARRQAEEATRARSEFVANVSHEIRTPMNGVLGMVRLAMDSAIDEEPREYLRLAEESAENLLQLLNDVLDFSKIDAGHLTIESAPFHPRTVLEDAAAILVPRAAAKGVAVNCHVDPACPATVLGDAARLRQVVLNLLGNAVKFTASGSVDLSARLERAAGDRLVLHFEVRDTGVGIPADKLDLIFKPFRQVDSSVTRQQGGTGLGLTISARLVKAMGGRIWVESRVGQGSCFHFTLAVRRAAAGTEIVEAPSLAAGRRLRQITVLLAEDNQINQMVASRLLGKHGCTVDVASNGREALARLAERSYDVVLMDVQMPEMDGLTAAAAIREREKTTGGHLPIIALTAHTMAGDAERCLAAGMDAYVSKPLDPRVLVETLERLLPGK